MSQLFHGPGNFLSRSGVPATPFPPPEYCHRFVDTWIEYIRNGLDSLENMDHAADELIAAMVLGKPALIGCELMNITTPCEFPEGEIFRGFV